MPMSTWPQTSVSPHLQALRSYPDHPQAKALFKDVKKLQKHIKVVNPALSVPESPWGSPL